MTPREARFGLTPTYQIALAERKRFSSVTAQLHRWAKERIYRLIVEERERLGERETTPVDKAQRNEIRDVLRNYVVRNYTNLKTQLLDEGSPLHPEIDRRDSEGEFRLALVLPLAVLLGWLAFNESMLWLLGSLPVLGLYLQGRSLQLEAGAEMVGALNAKPELEFEGLRQARNKVREEIKPIPSETGRGATESGDTNGRPETPPIPAAQS